MKMIAPALAIVAALGLAACGDKSQADNTADALDNAAEQSTPEAAAVLENRADQIRDQNVSAPIDASGSPAQQAMQEAGNAQVSDGQMPPPKVEADSGNQH